MLTKQISHRRLHVLLYFLCKILRQELTISFRGEIEVYTIHILF